MAVHSVIIGLALGVLRSETETKTLLAALAFHQFFEGIALSSVLVEAGFRRVGTYAGLAGIYILSTPLGVVIGILISSNYNESSTTNLLTQGILESLAAGILTYDGLVNLVYAHFASAVAANGNVDDCAEEESGAGRRRATVGIVVQLAFLWVGAAGMAVVGAWA
ncbi:hypothetical protein HDU96_002163 [Phlyctochytrium bullatum]|nr:hypothetical protein HDU96_002163 [Phlyctochytrium bullatum]